MSVEKSGQCLCGSVKFTAVLDAAVFGVCHCGMCRKVNAGPYMGAPCSADVTFKDDRDLKWYASSDAAKRGFCQKCGTSLFYRSNDKQNIFWGVSVEALDDASDMTLAQHIFIDDKPDRYDFTGECPRLTGAEVMGDG